MIRFEDFVERARIDLPAYFTANNINCDETLKLYCLNQGLVPPERPYFPEPQPEPDLLEKKTENVSVESEVSEVLEEKPAPPKKTRTRKRTTRTTKAKTTRTTKTKK